MVRDPTCTCGRRHRNGIATQSNCAHFHRTGEGTASGDRAPSRLSTKSVLINRSNRQSSRAESVATIDPEPIDFDFVRNTESSKSFAPPPGMDFGQDIEPAGRYMSQRTSGYTPPDDRWVTGSVRFEKPLHVANSDLDPTQWKRELSEVYGGLTGKKLSRALANDGYDAIVTHDEMFGTGPDEGISEVVDLTMYR